MVFNPQWGHKLDAWMNHISVVNEYLNNPEWSEIVLKDSYDRYKDLISWGVKFYQEDGKLHVNRMGMWEGFNLVHREVAPALRKKTLASGVKIVDRVVLCELLKQDGKVVGAAGFHTTSGDLYILKAKATVIATGTGEFKAISAPSHYWTSDGEAMAYRAGAELTGKEFKFSSWMMALRPGKEQVITGREAIGKEVKDKESGVVGKIVDLATRFPSFRIDQVALKAVPTINAEGGPVSNLLWEVHEGRAPLFINLDAISSNPVQMEAIKRHLRIMGTLPLERVGFDIAQGGKLEFSAGGLPATVPVHGGGGGICPIDKTCATGLPGLYAAGDSCGTMADTIGYPGFGFGIMHASVTGTRAGLGAAGYALKAERVKIDEAELSKVKKIIYAPTDRKGGFSPRWVTQVLQNMMVPYFVLQIKHGERMQAALTLIEFLNNHLVPKLVAKDAAPNSAWLTRLKIRRSTLR